MRPAGINFVSISTIIGYYRIYEHKLLDELLFAIKIFIYCENISKYLVTLFLNSNHVFDIINLSNYDWSQTCLKWMQLCDIILDYFLSFDLTMIGRQCFCRSE